MYQDEFSAMTNAAAAKVGLLKKNPSGIFSCPCWQALISASAFF